MSFEKEKNFTIKQNILFYCGCALKEIRWLLFLIAICFVLLFLFRELFVGVFQYIISLLTNGG
jgi:hypothetical protein